MSHKSSSRFTFYASRFFSLGVLLLAYVLRFWYLGALPLIGDEAYYLLWSQRLDWAYFDHPAGVALLTRLSTLVGGTSEFGVRWLNAAVGVLIVALLARVGRVLLSRRAGVFAAMVAALGAPFVVNARFVYTDALQLALMLVNLWAFWRLVEQEVSTAPCIWRALGFGLSLALLFNTKYSAYVYAAALGLALLLWHRSLLRRWDVWLSAGVAALGLLPVLGWNAAHDWASFRWQLAHFTSPSPGADAGGLLRQWINNAAQAWTYLTPPVVLAGMLGLGRLRKPGERLLTLIALALLVPVALSAANSPRNLIAGWLLLLLLAGERLRGWRTRRWVCTAFLLLLIGTTALYGVGTVAALSGYSEAPQSSVVSYILEDVIGWPAFGAALSEMPGSLFVIDYGAAGQAAYYADRPAFTAWGQYQIWGYPAFDKVTVVARAFLPADCITGELLTTFETVRGPEVLPAAARGVTRELRVWYAQGLRVPQDAFLRRLDFLTLWEQCW